MKRLPLIALAALALSLPRSPDARADEPRTPSLLSFKVSPDLAALPEATLDPLRTPEVPRTIEAKEQAPGFWSGKPTWDVPAEKERPAPKKRGRKAPKKAPRPAPHAPPPEVTVIAPAPLAVIAIDKASPRLIGLGVDREGRDVASHDTCFSPAEGKLASKDYPAKFGDQRESVIVFSNENGPAVSPDYLGTIANRGSFPLRLIRAERLQTGPAGRASLEISHAWVDVRSGGARGISTQRIPLQQIQEAPGGVKVFAYRSGSKVTFVVQQPPSVPERDGPAVLQIARDAGSIEASFCNHVTIPLEVGHVGDAETTSVSGELVVKVETPAEAGGEPGWEIKLRPYRLSLSETWLSSDAAPVLSASFAWTGKLRLQGAGGEP